MIEQVIAIKNLTKSFDKTDVLNNISAEVKAGEKAIEDMRERYNLLQTRGITLASQKLAIDSPVNEGWPTSFFGQLEFVLLGSPPTSLILMLTTLSTSDSVWGMANSLMRCTMRLAPSWAISLGVCGKIATNSSPP